MGIFFPENPDSFGDVMAKGTKEKSRSIAVLSFQRWHCAETQPCEGNSTINFLPELLQYSLPRIPFNPLQIVILLHTAQLLSHFYMLGMEALKSKTFLR